MWRPPSDYFNDLIVFYACSNSSSLCPAGSGVRQGYGCSPCAADTYNDGSSRACRYCASGSYPLYEFKRVPGCDPTKPRPAPCGDAGCASDGAKFSLEKGCDVMLKGASSCSAQCPEGTGISGYTIQVYDGIFAVINRVSINDGQFAYFLLYTLSGALGGTWNNSLSNQRNE